MNYFISIFLSIWLLPLYATNNPQVFLFFGGDYDKLNDYKEQLENPNISGAQVIYTWKNLEPKKDCYEFSRIESALAYLSSLHKKLFIQIQDRFFLPQEKNIPSYLIDSIYEGGISQQFDRSTGGGITASGWVANQWNKNLRDRFQKLLDTIAKKFDGKIYGLNLPETAVDLNDNNLPEGYSALKYFYGELDNLKFAKAVFKKTKILQFVNFFPDEWENDHNYIGRFFEYAKASGAGVGGPDVVPYQKAQMKNSYKFFHDNLGKLPLVAMAVQEPDYSYLNPKTNKPFTIKEIASFAKNYLGANIIFWNIQEPKFTEEVYPLIKEGKLF